MKNALLIFRRELRDQLRDQRTLFLVLGLPMVLYPAMIYGTAQLELLHREQARTVVVLGADAIAEPPLIDGEAFVEGYLLPSESRKLRVVTDAVPDAVDHSPGPAAADDAEAASDPPLTSAADDDGRAANAKAKDARRLRGARRIAELLNQRDALTAGSDTAAAAEQLPPPDAEALELADRIGAILADTDTQVVILFPDGFADQMAAYNAALLRRPAGELPPRPSPQVVTNNADDKSQLAARRVRDALKAWEKDILARRLAEAGLPADLTDPVETEEIDVAPPAALSANLWSKLFPALLIIMAVTGAFYPAVDVCAGEKERGTMETILVCPAERHEVVLGKFLTVLLFSVATALLNLLSMGITAKYVSSAVSSGAVAGASVSGLELPPALSMVWIGVLLLPLAAFFSATSLALAMFARSTKEGQYYLTPLLVVSMGLTMFAIAPGVQITGLLSVMPVLGPALLLRAAIASPGDPDVLFYFLPVLVSTAIYCAVAMWWAVEQFRSEEVIFRGAEQFSLGLWLRSLVTHREATPSFAEAAVCFGMIMLLNFLAMPTLQKFIPVSDDPQIQMMRLLAVQQACLIALPALLMGFAFTRSLRETFRLRWPPAEYLLAGLLLPVLLHVPTTALAEWMAVNVFPEAPDWIAEAFAPLANIDIPTWKVVLAFAVMPAICEEIAFRGFLLSGFARRGMTGVGIVISALCFGLIHMLPAQVFNAALLGLLLGLLAVRSRSLLPGVIFHLIYNALQALRMRVPADASDPTGGWLFTVREVTAGDATLVDLGYGWGAIAICVALATPWIMAIYRDRPVVRHDRRGQGETSVRLGDEALGPAPAGFADAESSVQADEPARR